ncbi:MAG: altronate dehydratase family protein [Thermoanaerobaculia bacterium]|nr:altronate dehydratase family protein [Thermoanaerobaculia bacterium]
MPDLALLHPADNVAVVLRPGGLAAGSPWAAGTQKGVARGDIPQGHKIAVDDVVSGGPILKYGLPIARAARPIARGDHVHTHNATMPGLSFDDGAPVAPTPRFDESWQDLPSHFLGYLRPDGSAGTRNNVIVAATVNCSATVVKAICRRFEGLDLSNHGVDGVIPLTHTSGCTQAIGGPAYRLLNRTLAGSIFHPNVAGALVVGLGCEGTTFRSVLQERARLGPTEDILIETLGIQEAGGTQEAVLQGVAAVERILASLPVYRREPLPVGALKLALNCGGSDAFSGLTANPALGVASDILVAKGGTTVLAEIPECHGAESALMSQAATPAVAKALNELFAWWRQYAQRHGVELNDNLSPGNIAGGITTIVEKSLGAVAKAGTSALTEVVEYAGAVKGPGFVLMNTPGFDPVSVTGLVSGGCNIVAFTTGRGSAYGSALAPTLKISTTSALFQRMRGDMDIDAGPVLQDGSPERAGVAIYQRLIQIASGEKTCSERLGMGWEEFVPWAFGETL